MDVQRCLQATSSPVITGSANLAASNASHGDLPHIKEEPEDEDVDIGPTVFQHMDSHYRTNQMNIEQGNVIKPKKKIADEHNKEALYEDEGDQVLCSQENVEIVEKSQKGSKRSPRKTRLWISAPRKITGFDKGKINRSHNSRKLENKDEGKKRDRSVNFSQEETDLLVFLVEKRKNVIENKKSGAITWHTKVAAWTSIENEFNSSSSGVFRDSRHLKIKYEAMKRDTRKKSALDPKEHYKTGAEQCKTGAGPSTAPPLINAEDNLKDVTIISVEELDSVFNSNQSVVPENYDNIMTMDVPYDASIEEPRSKKSKIQVTPDPVSNKMDIQGEEPQPSMENLSHWKPASLESKKQHALSKSKDTGPFEKLTEAKMEMVLLQKKMLDEEYTHKQQIYELEIQQNLLRIKILEKELEIKEKIAHPNN